MMQYSTLPVQDTGFFLLDNYRDRLHLEFGISNDNQRFFYLGKQANVINLQCHDSKDFISVVDLSKFQSKTINFKIKVWDNENNEELVKFFPIDLVRFKRITVMDGLIHVIKKYDLKEMFYNDFDFGLVDFEDIIEKPLSCFEDSETIPINFKKKTEILRLKYYNNEFIYKAGLKTVVKNLLKKIQIVLRLHDQKLSMQFRNIQISDLDNVQMLPIDQNVIRLQSRSSENQSRGLSLVWKCQNKNCQKSVKSNTKLIGLGVFDLKKLSSTILCELCSGPGTYGGFYLKNTRISILGNQNSIDITQSNEYFRQEGEEEGEGGNLFNYDIRQLLFIILLCI